MPSEVHKVACYVVQGEHLLVLTHDDVPITLAGVQVPAGTIETGESPEEAAVRELYEETSRRGRLIRGIGIQRYDLRPARNEVAVRHYFQLGMPNADLTERWSAGENDSSNGEGNINWTCWWMPLTDAHVLAAGLGALLGAMVSHPLFSGGPLRGKHSACA